MAQRLGTKYVITCLKLTDAELTDFYHWFTEQQYLLQIKVFDNGMHEVVLGEENDQQIVLSFTRKNDCYVGEGTCLISSASLANVFRNALSHFKGDAVAHRMYRGFVISYRYSQGKVVQIMEMRDKVNRLIYETKDYRSDLEELYSRKCVEEQIKQVRHQVNQLLDHRNALSDQQQVDSIDEELSLLTHMLFVLEA
ncbi:MAG: hypothetical protein A2189_04980 [Paenibacillus sp. RIFOXYA1_FULL_44_5]|nr:MAG: hypothetical protein A2189_04980 [Paenibacillus sp. RIFOXYA1_FULL_44_5]